MKKIILPVAVAFVLAAGCTNAIKSVKTGKDWPRYGGNWAGNRYSPLNQINAANVNNLQVAWMYNTVDPPDPASTRPARPLAIQCQPIVVNGVLYGTSGELKLFALNAGTGQQLWKFAPAGETVKFNTNRGVVYWAGKNDERILYTAGSNLYAVNAKTGALITSFGNKGIVDLHEGLQDGLDTKMANLGVTASSPGVVYKNTFVIGSAVSEAGDAAPGYIRAFDVITGKLKWVFHTIPRPGEVGYESWPKDAWKEVGGVNSWSGMVLDEQRGAVYFGTGSPGSDFYGGNRAGANLFATSIMSLNAETGKMNWYYQTIHHDLWDRDHPTPPNLTSIVFNNKKTDVVVQATKDGLVYVLDRDNGTSLFPVEERPVPTNGLPGEKPYPTQKFPTKPLPFSHQVFTEADITDISPAAHDFVKQQYLQFKTDNKFEPPSTKGTILFGYSGGAEWGGNTIDPDGILYQNANDDPWILQMIDTATRNQEIKSLSRGNALYLTNCAPCHGADRRGNGTEIPNLITIAQKRSADEILNVVKTGMGRMPSFAHLTERDRKEIVSFLVSPQARFRPQATERSNDADIVVKNNDFGFKPVYINKVWKRLVDQDGYPGIKPPWGTLNAIDLKTGDYLWRVPLGEYPELAKKGVPTTGTDSYGGPISTAGGLIFIAGTKDEKIRAFDKKTGKVVWEYQLPAGGFATPITYQFKNKQYIVIAAGGARGQKAGGNYIAFALK
jgi:quinoprotein glucose dehydrogenase